MPFSSIFILAGLFKWLALLGLALVAVFGFVAGAVWLIRKGTSS